MEISIRKELDWCIEVIKLLERQRHIYRTQYSACTCSSKNINSVEFRELAALDHEIEQIYKLEEAKLLRQGKVPKLISSLPPQGNIVKNSPLTENWTNSFKLIPSLFGVDLRSCKQLYLNTQLDDLAPLPSDKSKKMKSLHTNESQKSEGKKLHNHLPSSSRKSSRTSSSSFRCNFDKCRFSGFTQKSLLKHQLEHRRLQFVDILKPHGFTLNHVFEIVPNDSILEPKQIKIQKCCFPFCNFEFQNINLQSIVAHFKAHLPSYVSFPCFSCQQTFDNKQSLLNHLVENLNCGQEILYTGTGCSFWTDEEVIRLRDGLNQTNSFEITTQNGYDLRYQCKSCNRSYAAKKWLDFHVKLFHLDASNDSKKTSQSSSDNATIEVIELNDDDEMNGKSQSNEDELNSKISGPKVKCKRCSDIFDNYTTFQTHVQILHHMDNAEDLVAEKIDQSSENETNSLVTTIVPIDHQYERQKNSETFTAPNILEPSLEKSWVDQIDNPSTPLTGTTAFTVADNSGRSKSDSTTLQEVTLENDNVMKNTLTNIEGAEKLQGLNFLSGNDKVEYQIVLDDDDDSRGVDVDSNSIDMDNSKGEDYMVIKLLNDGNIQILDKSAQLESQSREDNSNSAESSTFKAIEVDSTATSSSSSLTNSTQTAADKLDSSCKLINREQISNDQNILQILNTFIYDCSICKFSFRTEHELAMHIYLVHKMQSYCCKQCEFVTQDNEIFRLHEQLHNSGSQFQCTICWQLFDSSANLVNHNKAKHINYQCTICELILPNRSVFQSHMVSYHRYSAIQCEFCPYKTYIQEHFNKHKRMHSDYKVCSYEGCGESFLNLQKLDAHINRFHRQERVHKCTISGCAEAFYNIKMLHKHLIDIHNEFIFKCDRSDSCNFKTNHERVFNMHLQIHSNERPFKCTEPGCDHTSRTKILLESHYKHRHTTEKSFVCTMKDCDRRFKTKPQLMQHNKRFHGEKGPSSSFSGDLEQLFSDTQFPITSLSVATKPYKCPHEDCQAHFGKRTELERHVKSCTFKSNSHDRAKNKGSKKKLAVSSDVNKMNSDATAASFSIILDSDTQMQQMDITTEISTITEEDQFLGTF